MVENLEPDQFAHYFGFLKEEYGFKIQQTVRFFGSLYVASSNNCLLRITLPIDPNIWPAAVIEPTGTALQKLTEDGCRQRSMYISHIGYCLDNSLELPNHWEEPVPKKTLPTLATYVKKYCAKMLQGDFSQWTFLEKRIRELLHDYKNCGYQIVKQEEKYGLSYNRTPVLEPIYSSVEVTNKDSHEYTLKNYKDDSSIVEVNEYNFPIVIADGKYGLLSRSELTLGLDYTRIIKLTFCHYLCQKDDSTFVLYDISSLLNPLAAFTTIGEINLSKFLQILQNEHPKAFAELEKRIHKRGNRYISEYRRYDGIQVVDNNFYHDFYIATVEVELNDEFHIS
jgi:hypothetical protein